MADKRKKPRTAKQKAATRKLVALNKAKKGSKSTPKKTKSTSKRKPNKQKSTTKNVAAKKKKGILDNIPLINNPTFKKAALGVGTATLGVTVLGLVAPSIAANPIVKPVLALAGGGVPGVIAQVLAQGGLQGLGLGNGGGNGMGVNPGFA